MRKSITHHLSYIIVATLIALLSSCSTTVPQYDYQELARASIRLGMDIEMKDHHALYIASAEWMGVPYRNGGKSKKGVDCSALTAAIYKKAYRKKLERNANDQRKDANRISKRNLREGDLVFFHNGRKKRTATHVGIYLKDGKFIHASTSRGVIVSHLDEEYWRKHWICGGRP